MNRDGRSLTLVSATDCHLCSHTHELLHRMESEFHFIVLEIDWESPEGQTMVQADGVPFPPALYIEGRFVAYGRLSEKRIRQLLAESVPR